MLRARRRPILGRRAGLGCAALALACMPAAAQTGAPAALAPQAAEAGPTGPEPAAEPQKLPDPRLAALDRRIDEVDRLLGRAQFHTALGLARNTLERLDAGGEAPHPDRRRARLEVLAATAEVALGRRDAARESLGRALQADPALALDRDRVSPKVLKLLQEARLARGGEEAKP
jgi:hypothetical protein